MIERVAGKQHERQAARVADFRGLVAKIADGQEPDADTVDSVLSAAGKTADDLREAVERLAHRRQLREQFRRLPELEAEKQKVEREIASANAALEAAERRHHEAVAPLEARLAEIRELVSAGEAARRHLADGCTDAGLLARYRKLEAALAEARHAAAEHRAAADSLRERARAERGAAERFSRILDAEAAAEAHLARAKQHEQKVRAFAVEAGRADKRAARLEREVSEIRGRMAEADE